MDKGRLKNFGITSTNKNISISFVEEIKKDDISYVRVFNTGTEQTNGYNLEFSEINLTTP